MIGETFGSYQILEKRGEGGMGMFFKAKDLQLDRIVGLKTLRPELLADAALRQRLQTEAKSLARLVHQNIANVLHYLVVGEQSFIVMEYVEGLDLADIVRRSGLVPLDRLGPLVTQISAAIDYAHSKNVIHRDLKPSNIMVTEDWTVKVTDFGIAKIIGDKAQTRTGMAAGSLHYMAPEQIRATGVDARTDIYQLGATLYELTAGRRPFVSDSEYELMTMHLQDAPEPPSAVNTRVSAELDAVILKALAKNPDDRYQNARELNDAYQTAIGNALAAGKGRGDAPTMNQLPFPSADQPTTIASGREEKTVFAGGAATPKSKPKPKPRDHTVTPEWSSDDGNKKPLWPWLAGAGVLVVAVLLYLFWPSGGPETPTTATKTPDTTATNASAMSTLIVHAQVPSGIRDDQVDRAVVSINHPLSGMRREDVTVRNGVIDKTITVAPVSELSVTIQGFNKNEDGLFTGVTSVNARAGEDVQVDVPLMKVYDVASTGNNGTPSNNQQSSTTTPTGSADLTINVTPFDARSRVTKVWLDGKPQTGADLFKLKTSPGKHTVRFMVGSDLLTDTVTVAASGTEKSFFIGSGRGDLSVAADFGPDGGYADITVDGEPTGQGTPKMLRDLLEGPHEVSVSQTGYRTRSGPKIVNVKANGNVEVNFTMVKR